MLDKYIVEEGYNRNILVYDCDAFFGEFTLRLAALLRCVARRNQPRGHIEAVYIPEEIQYDESLTTGGLYIIPDKRLNLDGELLKHFFDLGGVLAASRVDPDDITRRTKDRYLCVGVSPTTTILGSIP